MGLALGGIAAFYLVSAGAASIAGARHGAIALLAGVVPAPAAMLLIATMRQHRGDYGPAAGHHAVGLVSIPALGALHRRARLRDTVMGRRGKVCSVSPVAVPAGRAGRA